MYRTGRGRLGDEWWTDPSVDDVPEPEVPAWPDVYVPPPPATMDLGFVRPPPDSADANVITSYTPPRVFTDYTPERPPPQDVLDDAGGFVDPVEVAIQSFYRAAGGDTLAADGAAMRARAADVGGNDEVLRNAQHALVTQQAIEEYGVAGAAMALVAVPAYSAAKWVAQNVPGAAALLQPFTNDPLTREGGASAPSWSEIWWGLRPIWSPLK